MLLIKFKIFFKIKEFLIKQNKLLLLLKNNYINQKLFI